MRLSGQLILGIIIIFFGLNILFSTLNITLPIGQIFVPLLFILGGLYFWQKSSRLLGGVLAGIGAIAFFNHVLHINIAGIFIALALVFFGFRLLNQDHGKNKEEDDWGDWDETGSPSKEPFKASKKHRKKWAFEDDIDREIEQMSDKIKSTFSESNHEDAPSNNAWEKKERPQEENTSGQDAEDYGRSGGGRRTKIQSQEVSSILGDFMLRNHRFELNDLVVNNGIGDVKIDLSKAILPPGETTLDIRSWLGDIQIYVPYELEVSVRAQVALGELDILGHQQDGFSRRFSTTSNGFDSATKRVRLTLSSGLGEIDVRYV